MNRFLFVRRLRGPAFLLLFGLTALLDQWNILDFGHSWPLYFILLGALRLVENASLWGQPAPVYTGTPPWVPAAAPGASGWAATPPPPPATPTAEQRS